MIARATARSHVQVHPDPCGNSRELLRPLPLSPRITVAMPCLNEATHIRRILQELLIQELDRGSLRIVVADGGSEDDTLAIVQELAAAHSEIVLLHNPSRFAGGARNLAIRSGPFDVLIVVDAHCHLPEKTFFNEIISSLNSSRAYCLSRPQPLCTNDVPAARLSSAVARASWLGHCPGSLIYDTETCGFVSPISGGQVYRREVFDVVGGFAEHLSSCEDLEFNVRVQMAGLSTFHSPQALVEYWPRETLRGLFHHMFRYGYGRTLVARMHNTTSLSLTGAIPALFLLYLLVAPVVHLVHPRLGQLHLGSILIYVFVILVESGRHISRRGIAVSAYLPLQFLAIHFGWGAGGLTAIARRPRVEPSEIPGMLT